MTLLDSAKQRLDYNIEPTALDDFVGQDDIKKHLKIYIKAALQRKESLDHIIFSGPPGLGKTTLSSLVSKELNVGFEIIGAPMLNKVGELVAILTNLKPYSVLFIDEIHRLSIKIEETLYSAMQRGVIDIVIGDGAGARTLNIELPPFTLIGATTRLGLLSKPLRDRFGILFKLEFYDIKNLNVILLHAMQKLQMIILDEKVIERISLRSRGTPRIALRLLRRVRDFIDLDDSLFKVDDIEKILNSLKIDKLGLDSNDITYLKYLLDLNSPVGLNTIAAAIAESKDTIEDIIEPYLLQIGFINRTARGRILTNKSREYLNDSIICNI